MRHLTSKITVGFLMVLVISTSAAAINRGEALSEIISALSLPLWNGKSFSDVPKDHPSSRYVESAFSMGILFPSDRFYPDIEISKAEAIAFSFRAMGWQHEAQLVASLGHITGELPPYLEPYVNLAGETEPKMPSNLLRSPSETLKEDDLKELTDWLKDRIVSGLRWDMTLNSPCYTLYLHREGVGRPPKGWAIALSESATEEKAKAMLKKLNKLNLPSYIERTDCAFSVRIGPYNNYAQAWLLAKGVPREFGKTSILPIGGGGRTLFWCMIKALPSKTYITTAPSIGARKLSLSEIGEHSKSTAAVNAGFFWKNRPVGTIVIDDVPVSPTYKDRSAIGWDQDMVYFGDGSYRLSAECENNGLPISAINQPTSEGKIGFYTPHFGQFATSIKGNGTEFLLQGSKTVKVRKSTGSNHFMKPEENILYLRTSGLGPLSDAAEIKLQTIWSDEAMVGTKQVIQAGPMILGLEGPFSSEWFSDSIINKRHPRTLAGWDGDRLCWIVIDGRSSWHSDGATLSEAAFIARQAGLLKAINMDGGGSSQMWWKGITVNRPSEGRERPLPYAVTFR
ncbi:phosphodiester glycosidase family protein [Dethiosulfovibrio sp. F2B]|uniref:phosphodiester glycosidase family protein n=1 Tax=Dethiosulfovibrio faecalis TaxID=2720018 RepID=UPI001F20E545|nr:phosphodiester glycosidase family protein [Dethiosulfovibrio faecalis]MCF4151128.1 phosphodiester glycosidase family protein [Dethiosulfovibrio faecalis]